MAKARLGLVGYFGYGNFGDELFLDVYRKYFYDCELIVIPESAHNPIYGNDFGRVEEIVNSVDAIIIGGGDLFIPKYFAQNYFQQVFLRRPIFFNGVGVPLWIGQDPEVIAKMARFASHPNVKRINARDTESVDWLVSKLSPTAPVVHSADMVFSLDLPKVEKDPKKKVFGVITRWDNPGTIRWDRITALCDRARSYGYEVHNIILGTGKIRDDDIEALKEWDYSEMITVDPQDLNEMIKAIARCDVLASTKFHGCVVATAYGIPTITMTTTDKFINLFRGIDRPDLISHFLHDDLVTHLSKYMARIPRITVENLRSDADNSMKKLRREILGEV